MITEIQTKVSELAELLEAIKSYGEAAPHILHKLAAEKSAEITLRLYDMAEEPIATPEAKIEPEIKEVVEPEPTVIEPTVVVEVPAIEPEPEPVVKEAEEVEEAKEVVVAAPQVTPLIETPPAPVTIVSPKPQMGRAKDIRKSISLIDRFLFKRELFDNSDDKFNTALNAINGCADYSAARTWIEANCGWDLEEATPAHFLNLVEKYFV